MIRQGAARSLLYPTSGRPFHHTTGNPDQPGAAPAEQFDVHPRHIGTATDFAAAHRGVIEGQIAANDRAAKTGASLLPAASS